jgi:hypothetical protein
VFALFLSICCAAAAASAAVSTSGESPRMRATSRSHAATS